MKTKLALLIILTALMVAACSDGDKKEAAATPELTAASNLNISYEIPAMGDAEKGAEIFQNGAKGAPACKACHQTEASPQPNRTAPNLADVGERASSRLEGFAAQEYIMTSILNPSAYVVEGYSDIMYPNYAEHFSSEDLANLIAYLLTL